ncbi:F-box only protein 40 [Betta splendens]|uniref:F-box only protein 40 n=1 Tax=Betta splendens TaxID=158456 RepID=A0A6P7P6K7_BETSP|nr:F-box only protein 40 [Betta splendens]
MVRTRNKPAGRHEHCDGCYNAHCQVPVHVSVSCAVIRCRKHCGAAFHVCKEEEHRHLCPLETAPCLNAHYGCPLRLPRHRLAPHLRVCPASVVCCSQEWNRWPVSEADQSFYRNVVESSQAEPHLDVALALRDQELLFRSIKMKDVFPELVMEDPEEEAGCSSEGGEGAANGCRSVEDQEQRGALVASRDVEGVSKYSAWEKIFAKEMEGCKQTVRNLSEREEEGREREVRTRNGQREAGRSHPSQDPAPASSGATGLAPWQDGVLERLGKEVNIAEYNMYLVHNGAMLIDFGQLAACTPREKDFVYGNLEPIEVRSVRSFNVPTSYRAKRNHLKDPARKPQVRHQSVDTADLGAPVEAPRACQEVRAALLCCLEKEARGHAVSESAGIDGLYVSEGTQTYSFASAPFRADASLADVLAGEPRGLHVRVEEEPVTRRHNRSSSAFSRVCGRFFRRDEFRRHFRNVHCDVQSCVSGWLQQRCPLAYLGCTFSQTRLRPAGHQGPVRFCQSGCCFVLQPHVSAASGPTAAGAGAGADPASPSGPPALSAMPLEILQRIAAHLDSFTLSQLSQVSRLMRDVCATLLQERGMVSLKWEKKTYSHGGSSWRCRKKVWEFSSLFSPVDRWSFSAAPSMSNHLKTCAFYQRQDRTEPVLLACLREARDKVGGAEHRE